MQARQDLHPRQNQADVPSEIAECFNQNKPLRAILDEILPLICDLFHATAGWIWLKDAEGYFILGGAYRLPHVLQDESHLMWPPCRCQKMFRDGTLSFEPEIRLCKRLEKVEDLKLQHHVSVPLQFGEAKIGILNLGYETPRRSFSNDEATTLRLVGKTIGGLIYAACAKEEAEKRRAEGAKQTTHHYELLLQSAGEGICGLDVEGRVTFVNYAALQMLRYEPEELVGEFLHELIHPQAEDGSVLPWQECPICRTLLEGSSHFRFEDVFVRKDGRPFPVEFKTSPILEDGQVTGAVIVFTDITQRKRMEKERRRLEAIVEETPAFVFTSDPKGNVLYFNRTGRKILGLQDNESLGEWKLSEETRKLVDAALASGGVWQGEREGFLRKYVRDGEGLSVLQTIVVHKDDTGEVEFLSTMAVDMTEQKRSEKERARLLAIIEDTPDYVSTADADTRVLYLNKAGRQMIGIPEKEDVRGLSVADVHPEWARRLIFEEGLEVAARDGMWSGETALLSRDGREIPVLQVIVAHKDEQGQLEYYSTIARDITDRKRMEKRLSYLVTCDPLTGMLNRTSFQKQLAHCLDEAKRKGTTGAVLYIDLDHFKDINDSLGHHTGDVVLQHVANVIQKRLRKTDVAARLGGDEFAILLPETSAEEARAVAKDLLQLFQDEELSFGRQGIMLRASIGIVPYPHDSKSVEEVLIHADLAMYAAKRDGGHRIRVHSRQEGARQRISTRMSWEQKTREALEKDAFIFHWQPLLDLQKQRITGYELLIRMIGEDGGLIMPQQFLPVAERSDLIRHIDHWVVRNALHILARTSANDEAGWSLHFNLSGKTFSDPSFIPYIQEKVEKLAIDPSRVVVEITETAAISDIRRAAIFVRSLKKIGLRFALDDFGVGFSNFNALRTLEVDILKIDGSFIQNLLDDRMNQELVKAMARVARGVGMKTVAEFVSDDETMHKLLEFGVDYGQGYHIGKPGPLPTNHQMNHQG